VTRRRLTTMLGLAIAIGLAVSTAQSGAVAKATCNDSNPVLIGTLYSMSGPAAGIGKLAQQGASMAVRDINASGGIVGRCVKEDLKDDTGSPTTAAQVIREAIDQDHATFIIGPFLSSPTAVTLPVTTQAKVIQMNNSALLVPDWSLYPYAFKTETNSEQQAQIFLPFLKAHNWTRVAVYAPNNAFGTVFVPTFTKYAAAQGITVVKSALVVSGTPDVTPQMTDLKNADPQALVWAVNADPDQIAALKARYALGWDVPVLGTSALQNTSTTNNFTAAQLKTVYAYAYKTMTYTAQSPKPADPLAQAFISGFAKWIHAHGIKESISQAAGAYDSFILLAKAANAVKSVDSDKIKQYFETHRMNGVRGHYIWTATQHDGVAVDDFGMVSVKSLNAFGILKQVK